VYEYVHRGHSDDCRASGHIHRGTNHGGANHRGTNYHGGIDNDN
jgi:hypothetical protein